MLKTVAGARAELTRLYLETKKGLLDPQIAGRLAHILSIMIGTHRDHEFEAKLTELEARIDERLPPPPGRANGHASARQFPSGSVARLRGTSSNS
jgi:hypothetical protein